MVDGRVFDMIDVSNETEIDVIQALADGSPLHVMDIADAVDGHPITIDQTCARLYDEGFIFPLGRGRYEITDKGVHRLETRCDR